MFVFGSASCSLDSLQPTEPGVVHVIPSSAPSSNSLESQLDAADATQHQLERTHAAEVTALFPSHPACHGFVLARVVDNGRRLELRWLSFVATAQPRNVAHGMQLDDSEEEYDDVNPYNLLDREPDHPPVSFQFADKLVSGISLTEDTRTSTLLVVVCTEGGRLYRLAFAAPTLFYGELSDEYVTEYEIACLQGVGGAPAGKAPTLLHSLHSDGVLVATGDGTIVKLVQQRAALDSQSVQLHEGKRYYTVAEIVRLNFCRCLGRIDPQQQVWLA